MSNGACQSSLNVIELAQVLRNTLGLRYNFNSDRFMADLPGQPATTVLAPAQLMVFLANTMAQHPDRFSPQQLRPRGLKNLLVRLKALCASPIEDLYGLDQFVATRLAGGPGSDVTSAEALESYLAFIRGGGGVALSPYQFHRHLPAIIKDKFSIAKRHDIVRLDPAGRQTTRNGWRGLGITDSADTTDTADGKITDLSTTDATGTL